jgi:type II secretory pathway pseudopilin PulG
MGQPIPAQHPSVVLRSHFKLVKGLLAIAMVAVLALTAAVVMLSNDDVEVNTATKAAPALQQQQQVQTPAGTRFDGGPEEGTRGLASQASPPATTRFDGGPEEGTRGPRSYYESPNQRSSYQPAPADGFKDRAGGPRMIPMGPGAQ